MARPFRFAVRSSQVSSGRDLREKARQAEDLGYYAYHVTDHVLGPGDAMSQAGHAGSGLAVVPALMALADATDHLRVGSRVICLDFHHPVVLANEMADDRSLLRWPARAGHGSGLAGQRIPGDGDPIR